MPGLVTMITTQLLSIENKKGGPWIHGPPGFDLVCASSVAQTPPTTTRVSGRVVIAIGVIAAERHGLSLIPDQPGRQAQPDRKVRAGSDRAALRPGAAQAIRATSRTMLTTRN